MRELSVLIIAKMIGQSSMNNVYDIVINENLNLILPLKERVGELCKQKLIGKVVIVIHLHYIDAIEFYLNYVENIPEEIDIIFTVSNLEVEKKISEYKKQNSKKYKILMKENRGRDISAFLVACREDILQYEYVCFIHDKKEKDIHSKDDMDQWIKCLWDNTLGSKEYIYNILALFLRRPQLGILVPPTPISENFDTAYINTWYKNFDNTYGLAAKMKLSCDLNKEKPPITIGTVFWAKVSALKKLFEIEWRYEDFDEEPLPGDGTLSHAIERIFAYVGQDAGYDTGIVMNDYFAGQRMGYIQIVLKNAFERLSQSLDIKYISELNNYEKRIQEILKFVSKYECLYIYGAGAYGRKCYNILLKEGLKKPKAFLVSDMSGNTERIQDVPVCSVNEIELDEQCGIIIGVSRKYQKEILEQLYKKDPSFNNIYLY